MENEAVLQVLHTRCLKKPKPKKTTAKQSQVQTEKTKKVYRKQNTTPYWLKS